VQDFVAFTNIGDDDATLFFLVRRGYGSLTELQQWDTPAILDAIEYERIQDDLEAYQLQQIEER